MRLVWAAIYSIFAIVVFIGSALPSGQVPIDPPVSPDIYSRIQEIIKSKKNQVDPQQQPAQKQDSKQKEKSKKPPLATSNDALLWALADIKGLDPSHWMYLRYIWIQNGDYEEAQATILTLNYISRSTKIVRPVPIGRDKLLLLRIDLRQLAPREEDLRDFTSVWEKLAFDSTFSLLITKDTLKFALGLGIDPAKSKKEAKKQPPKVMDGSGVKGKDGKVIPIEQPVENIGQGEDVDRIVAPHLNLELMAELVQSTVSQAPIVEGKYFLSRALTTIQDKGVYKTILSGLYYEFLGLRSGFKKGTDEDNLFESLGIGNVKEGINAKQVFDKLRSDSRVAVFRSNITSRPRRIDILRSLSGHVASNQSILSITHDLRRQSIDIGTHPLANLIDFKDDARELIFERANALHGFALFNGDGKLQESVPEDVAADHMIPSPHETVLQPAIGCLRCHAVDSGWRVLTNDVNKLVGKTFDIFDDLTKANKQSQSDTIDRLVGLYSSDPENLILPRARDDYARAILRATGPWGKGDQLNIVRASSGKIAEIYKMYRYDMVSPRDVLIDIGIEVDENAAIKVLSDLLPPIFELEDFRIAAFKNGLSLNRTDYILVQPFTALRANNTLRALQQKQNDKDQPLPK
jgi:hypothetical protein